MKPSFARHSMLACLAACVSACAHRAAPEFDPVELAALHASAFVSRGETTWVSYGRGYELAGRTRQDLAMVKPSLDAAAAFMGQIYPGDSIPPIVATIRRVPSPGSAVVPSAPPSPDANAVRVELMLVDRNALEEERKNSGNRPAGGAPPETFGRQSGNVAAPAVRAWLAARAALVSGTTAGANQSSDNSDSRVPAWAVDMVSTAGNEAFIDNATKSLAANEETVIPLGSYFTMQPPDPMDRGDRRAARSGGDTPPDGAGRGAGGGRGSGGGRGGRGSGGGRGGMGGGFPGGGGAGARGGAAARSFPLQGAALYAAESAVLTKYFERTEIRAVGDLIDAEITGKWIDDVFARYKLGSVEQVDADWRTWLTQRADMLNRR